MKKLIVGMALIASNSLFAMSDCIQFPILNNKIEKYNGVISDVDSEILYGNCPRTVLVNDAWVAQLIKVGDKLAEGVCIYRLNTATFACKH